MRLYLLLFPAMFLIVSFVPPKKKKKMERLIVISPDTVTEKRRSFLNKK